MKLIFIVLFLLVTPALFCQERKILHGQIVSDNSEAGMAQVFVINSRAALETKTDCNGYFAIDAKPGDVLTIYSAWTDISEFWVNNDSWGSNFLQLSVAQKNIQLEEVVIDKNITSESLGIVPKNQKKYTPAERKLWTASNIDPTLLLNNVLVNGQNVGNVIGVGVPTDALINALNGKTKRLKAEVELEQKEMLLEEVRALNSEEEVYSLLKIPKIYIEGFYHFIVEDSKFAEAMQSHNKSLVKLIMTELAGHYLQLISSN